jgi:ABC-2 type transport system permease protein
MHIITLMKPRFLTLKNSGRSGSGGGWLKHFILAGFGALFWAGIFILTYRMLFYFRGIEQIGDLLAFKLLSMLLITSFTLLIFSGILTSLTKLYLSRDLFLVHSLPVPVHKIFTARWIDSTIDSSWMVLVYTLPVFIAYGTVYKAGTSYYTATVISLVSLAVISSAISAALVMLAVILIPASRLKNIFVFLGLLLFLMLYILFRMMKPENMVDPEVFATVLIYLNALKTPTEPWLPSTWIFDAMKLAMTESSTEWLFHTAISATCAAMFTVAVILISDRIYYKGFSKSQTASARFFRIGTSGKRRLQFLPGPIRAFAVKEIRSFFRDQAQWSQLFLLAGLVVIYIYNFKVLPLDKSPIKTVYLQNLLAFLNMGLALFVLAAIAGRFAYPAVSMERDAIWIVRSAPISIRSFLWIKFFIYYFPLLVLAEILIIVTNILLQVSPFMMFLSTATIFALVPGIVAMGIGLGAAYPDFKAENPIQTVTSFGGLMFMIFCAGLIGLTIVLEAGPVYHYFITELRAIERSTLAQIWILGSFGLILLISALAVAIPMKYGTAKLSKRMM